MNSYKLASTPGPQQGYTLVELAISVAILSVLIVAGLLGVQAILTSGKVNDQIKTVAKLTAKASALFASTGTSGVIQKQMIQVGAWDASKANGEKVTSSFGSSETIEPNKSEIGSMPANSGFVYTIKAVPSAACSDLATGLAGFVFALNVQSVSGSAIPTSWTTGTGAVKAPGNANITFTNMATSCSNANTDFYMAVKP
jgi:prepilin-type N-terminal cleavage/methylation domain-containing protein